VPFAAAAILPKLFATGTKADSLRAHVLGDEYSSEPKIFAYPTRCVLFCKVHDGAAVSVSDAMGRTDRGESSQIAMPECGIGLVPSSAA